MASQKEVQAPADQQLQHPSIYSAETQRRLARQFQTSENAIGIARFPEEVLHRIFGLLIPGRTLYPLTWRLEAVRNRYSKARRPCDKIVLKRDVSLGGKLAQVWGVPFLDWLYKTHTFSFSGTNIFGIFLELIGDTNSHRIASLELLYDPSKACLPGFKLLGECTNLTRLNLGVNAAITNTVNLSTARGIKGLQAVKGLRQVNLRVREIFSHSDPNSSRDSDTWDESRFQHNVGWNIPTSRFPSPIRPLNIFTFNALRQFETTLQESMRRAPNPRRRPRTQKDLFEVGSSDEDEICENRDRDRPRNRKRKVKPKSTMEDATMNDAFSAYEAYQDNRFRRMLAGQPVSPKHDGYWEGPEYDEGPKKKSRRRK